MLEVNQLSLQLSEQAILQNISFQLQAGERVALTGASGSGKTTLLRTIAGLQRPDSGELRMNGHDVYPLIDQLVPGHPQIALVHQDFQLAHRVSVQENIRQKIRHWPAAEQGDMLQRLLESCHLTQIAKRPVELLSGGEKQRLALARALADEPELLLFDEPFSNLDPPLKEALKDELLAILDEFGLACLLVTHEPADALSVASRILVMQQGRIVEEGKPEVIYHEPQHQTTAALFGRCAFLKPEQLPHAWQRKFSSNKVCLRPEQLVIEKEAGRYRLPAQIAFCRFIGHAYLCALKLPDLPLFYAYSANALQAGETVFLGLADSKTQ